LLKRITFKNCKTVKDVDLTVGKINCIVGKNGVGKSTIIKSLNLFYESLDDQKSKSNIDDFIIYDKNNPYNKYVEIKLVYDFSYFHKLLRKNEYKVTSGELTKGGFIHKLGELDKHIDVNKNLTLTLKLDRDGKKRWIPHINYDLRTTLKTIFPFYFISLNDKKKNNWEDLWRMIEDLAAFSKVSNTNIFSELEENDQGRDIKKITEIIQNELNEADIIVKNYKNKENILRLIQLSIGGEELKFKYKDMDFFSEGTNSFNYLNIYCKLLNRISLLKIKQPILFLDEPEVGLHPKYIDFLLENILDEKNKYQVLLTTHSSRVLKNVVKNSIDYNIVHATKKNGYTKISNVTNFLDRQEKLIFSDEEGSYYLSDKIIFVEGKTELELFNNKNIISVFPKFKNVEIYSYNGDSQKLGTIHPKVRNTNIPYLIVVDGDYIYKVQDSKLKIINNTKDYLNPLDPSKSVDEHRKELFYIGEKANIRKVRNRINFYCEKNYYVFDNYWRSCSGYYFAKHLENIKEYCLKYNVYPVSTTIEGAIVNKNNVELFKEWLIYKNPYKERIISELYNYSKDIDVRTTLFRLCIDGKCDDLSRLQKVNETDPYVITNLKKSINNLKRNYNKASGWVTEWLDYILKEQILNEDTIEAKQRRFSYFFPELFDIISNISNK